MKSVKEPTFKFTWPHKMWPNGEGQYSGTDKKYIQWQRNEFKKLGYKVSKIVEFQKIKPNKYENE